MPLIFALEDDFEQSPTGAFREADSVQAIRQDLLHILEEAEAIGDPLTDELDGEVRATIVAMLGEHPLVASIDGIDGVADGESNTWTVSVYINGRDEPIAATGTGG